MNINSLYNTNFGSIKLYNVQLIKENGSGEQKPVKAYISLLEKSDLRRFDLKDGNWLDGEGYRGIGNDIIWDLQHKKKTAYWDDFYFLGIECPDEPQGEKIKAIAEAIKFDKGIKLSLMQSRTPWEKVGEKTCGAGSCLVYMLTKLAQKFGKDKIKVISLDDSSTCFYKKLGFEQDIKNIYIMNDSAIPQIQKRLEQKFKISPVESSETFWA